MDVLFFEMWEKKKKKKGLTKFNFFLNLAKYEKKMYRTWGTSISTTRRLLLKTK